MTQFADWPRFSSVKHPESCLELVDGIVKLDQREGKLVNRLGI